MNLDEMIKSMSREDIARVMSIVSNKQPRRVDTSRKAKSIAISDLYFSVAPLPHKTNYEEYRLESEAIRQQCISGVDI